MSEQLYTVAGTRIFISSRPVVAKGEVELADFASAEWIQIGGLYSLGELGGEQAINEFELIDQVWTRKSKGGRNGGTMTNQLVPMFHNPGQVKYLEAIESCRPYQFKVERGADCTPEAEVGITNAGPAVITWNAHGLFGNQPVVFTTTGSLPTGLVANKVYYVVIDDLTADTFTVSEGLNGAPISTTAEGAGIHTASAPPVGMTDLFQGLATDGARSGGSKNDLYTRTWPIAVDGRVVTV